MNGFAIIELTSLWKFVPPVVLFAAPPAPPPTDVLYYVYIVYEPKSLAFANYLDCVFADVDISNDLELSVWKFFFVPGPKSASK